MADPLWFDDSKVEKRVLECDAEEANKLGLGGIQDCDRLLELSWWPIIANAIPVAAEGGDCPLLFFDKSTENHLVVESHFGVLSRDPEKCRAVELRLRLSFEVYLKADSQIPLRPPVGIVAAWPKPKLAESPPISVTRGVTKDAALSLRYGLDTSLGRSYTFQERYDRFVPLGYTFVGKMVTPRTIVYGIRTTDASPCIEGQHYSGTWLSYESPCFVRVWADVEAWAECRTVVWNPWKRRRLKTERFAVMKRYAMFGLYHDDNRERP